MSNLRDLLSKANRKHEMRWKVLVFDPKKDNELVDEFKDFECIDCATAKKRELLEKHPDKTIEIIAESINRKTEAGKEIKVGNQRFYTTNDNGIILVRKIAPYDDADYYYAVYDPQKVRLVFTQSGGKNKQASMVKYNDTAKQIEEIAKKLIELNKHIQPKMVHESTQKNEEVTKSNYKSIINELEGIFKKFAGNGLELGHKVKPNSFDLPFDTSLSVALKDKTKLEPVKAALKKVIDKYGAKKVAHGNDFAYNFGKSNKDGIYVGWNWNANNAFVGYAVNPDFDAKALSESAQKNEALTNKEIAEVFRANGFKMVYVDANHVSGKKGNTKVWTYMDEKTLSTSDEPYTKGNYPQGFRKDPYYAQINAKLPTSKEELDKLLKSVKIESAQKNESYTVQNVKTRKDAEKIIKDKCKPKDFHFTDAGIAYDGKKNIAQYTPHSNQLVIFESAQINETRGYKVIVELGVPDNMNNRDIEDEVERLLRSSHKIDVVIDVTAERQ